MAALKVIIDSARKRAEFSGPGTFGAKDKIKALGPCRWDGARKVWEVRSFVLGESELREVFPDIEILVANNATGNDLAEDGSRNNSESGTNEQTRELVAESIPRGFSVSELFFHIKKAIENIFPAPIFVHGVISSLKEHNGRVFLELAEKERPDEIVRCVIWGNAGRIVEKLAVAGFKLERDLQIMFSATVGISNRDGRISLSILDVVPEFTLAKLAALRGITNERLKKEGIFAQNKQLQLPFLPKRLGLITSAAGTVINDFRASLDASQFAFQLFWIHVNVQGAGAKEQILDAISRLEKLKELDAILIFRGGGSQADLAVFNDYDVARAVCMCPLPVFSAIGHQEDQCSVQDVSYHAAGVPKDLGRYFADIVMGYREQTIVFVDKIRLASNACVERAAERVSALLGPLCALAGQSVIAAETGVGTRIRELFRETDFVLQKAEHAVDLISEVVKASSPEVQLRRGFALVRKGGNSDSFILRASELKEEMNIEVEFCDGQVQAKITEESKGRVEK